MKYNTLEMVLKNTSRTKKKGRRKHNVRQIIIIARANKITEQNKK